MADKDTKQLTSEEAKKLLMEEQKKQIEDCQKEIQAALEKHNCMLDASVILRAGQVIPNITVMAK